MTDDLIPGRQGKTTLWRRRSWIAVGLGTVAAIAGAGWHWWTQQRQPVSLTSKDNLWQQSFAQPGGGALEMASLLGKPLVLNFWASWCAPCVREMPELARFQRNNRARDWQVVGLAIDSEAAVVQFLERISVDFPIALAGLSGTELMKRLGNDKGGLPFTVLFDRSGRAVQRHLGETNYAQLEAWAQAID